MKRFGMQKPMYRNRNTIYVYMPVKEAGGTEVVVEIFWKVFELKKLLLSA